MSHAAGSGSGCSFSSPHVPCGMHVAVAEAKNFQEPLIRECALNAPVAGHLPLQESKRSWMVANLKGSVSYMVDI